MSTDPFTTAARAEAEKYGYENAPTIGTTALVARAHLHGWEAARAYLTERCTACGDDPSGPLRPLSTDERSYRRAQGLGYELPEDPR